MTRPPKIAGLVAIAALGLSVGGCRMPDPAQAVAVSGVEAYWVIDAPSGDTQYLAPAVRFVLRNTTDKPHRSLEAQAVFRRQGETEQWGSDWRRLTVAGKPLPAGQQTLVVMKSDARYTSTGPPDSMFNHELFRDVTVEVFVRLSSSPWHKVGQIPVERRIGTRDVPPAAGPAS